jgi:hypothetical protein
MDAVTSVRLPRRSVGVLYIALAIVVGAAGLTALVGAGGSDAPVVGYVEGVVALACSMGAAIAGARALRHR